MNCDCLFFRTAFSNAIKEFAFLEERERFSVLTVAVNYECSIKWTLGSLQLRLYFEMPDIPKLETFVVVNGHPKTELPVEPNFPESLQNSIDQYYAEIDKMKPSQAERVFRQDKFADLQLSIVRHLAKVADERLHEFQRDAELEAQRYQSRGE